MKNCYSLFAILMAVMFLNSCSELTSAEKYGDDIYAEVTITLKSGTQDQSYVKGYVGKVIYFNTTKDIVPSATKLTEKWRVEPASIAIAGDNGEVEITDLGKANVIVSLYDKKQNLVASDTVVLYSEAKMTLELDNSVHSFTKYNDGNGIFLGTSGSASIYYSTDNGDRWNPVQIPVSNSVIRNIARSPVEPNHLAATYRELNECCNDEAYTGVLVSRDNGQSWEEGPHPYEYKSGDHFYDFSDIAFAPDDSETFYILSRVHTEDGGIRLFKSTDFGKSWQTLKTFNWGSSTLPTLFVDNHHTIVVASAGSVNGEKGFVSTDFGSSWNSWPVGTIETLYHMDDNGGLYSRTFKGNSTYTPQQIIYSGDKGQSWDVILEHDSYRLADVDTYAINNVAVLVNTDFGSGFLIIISKNGGSTWKEVQPDLNISPYNRPSNIKILEATEDRMTMLVFIGESSFNDDESQVWKMMVYYDS